MHSRQATGAYSSRRRTAGQGRKETSRVRQRPRAGRDHSRASLAYLSVSDAVQHEEVDPAKGLSPPKRRARLQKYGPNAFAQAEKEPGWRAFLRQFRDPMQIVLLVAGVVSGIAHPAVGHSDRVVWPGAAQRRDVAAAGGQG